MVTVAAGAVLAAGVLLRFVTTSDLWLDEALTVNIAELPLGDLHEALRHDGAPPLYYLLLHGWIEVFGSGDLAVRSLSAVFAVAALPLAWLAGRRVGGRVVGWGAVLLLASSPYALRYATEARMYALQMFLVLAGYLALARALERPTVRREALVAVLAGLLLYTQYWSMYLLAAVGVGLVVRAWRAPRPADRHAARSAVVALGAGAITFLPWIPTFLYQAENTGTPWGEPVFPSTGLGITASDFAGGDHSEANLLLPMLLALGLLGLFGRPLARYLIELDVRTRPGVRAEAAVLAGALVLGLSASFAAGTAFQGRYAAVVFPLFVLLMAAGLRAFADARARALALGVVVLVGFAGGVRNVAENRTQASQSADIIRAEAEGSDLVAYCPDQVAPDVSRLLEGGPDVEHLTFPDGKQAELVDWVDYEDRVQAADAGRFARKAVRRAGPQHDVWLVIAPGYRNFEGECETVSAALGALRKGVTRVEPDDSFFEFQGLVQYSG